MFSDYFDIYFFDDLALATLATVTISDSAVAEPGTLTVLATAVPVRGVAAVPAEIALSSAVSANLATIVTAAAGVADLSAVGQITIILNPPAAHLDLTVMATPTMGMTATGSLAISADVGSVFAGKVIAVPAAQAAVSGVASPRIGLRPAAATIAISGVSNIDIALLAPVAGAIISASSDTVLFERALAVVRYYFVLTADGYADVTIPITTLNGRIRQGTPSYLQVTIPGLSYINHITNRADGEMIIYLVYVDTRGSEFGRREIARANLETIRYDQGGKSQSITLTGHKTTTFADPRTVTIKNPTYKSYHNGALRFRAPLDLAVYPGDTAIVGSDSFLIDNLTYTIGVGQANMEISEAAA